MVIGGAQNQFPRNATLHTAELYNPATGIWTRTGNMHVARAGPLAVRLRDGRVLVAGGQDGSLRVLASAEIFNPVTGRWQVTGSATVHRWFASGLLLPSGKVLAIGGANPDKSSNNVSVRAVEVYDPATGRWRRAGRLRAAWGADTVTLLPTGKVLVTGGVARKGAVVTATEVYDPVTGTSVQGPALRTNRSGHTATLLPGGQVLVAGGVNNNGDPLRSAETYP